MILRSGFQAKNIEKSPHAAILVIFKLGDSISSLKNINKESRSYLEWFWTCCWQNLAALVENNFDGKKINIPNCLHKYLDFKTIEL